MKYKLTSGTSILRDDGASIPADPANADYQAYQAWIAAGNTPTPADQPTAQQTALAQIVAIEQANPFTHRHFRDAFDTITQVIAAVNPQYDMSKIPGFAQVAAVEAQIKSVAINAGVRAA